MVSALPELSMLALEEEHRRIDQAEQAVLDALESPEARRQEWGASMILKGYRPAQDRGWRQGSGDGVNVNLSSGERETVVVTWQDGTVVTTLDMPAALLPRTIEHDADERARVDEERRPQGDEDLP